MRPSPRGQRLRKGYPFLGRNPCRHSGLSYLYLRWLLGILGGQHQASQLNTWRNSKHG